MSSDYPSVQLKQSAGIQYLELFNSTKNHCSTRLLYKISWYRALRQTVLPFGFECVSDILVLTCVLGSVLMLCATSCECPIAVTRLDSWKSILLTLSHNLRQFPSLGRGGCVEQYSTNNDPTRHSLGPNSDILQTSTLSTRSFLAPCTTWLQTLS